MSINDPIRIDTRTLARRVLLFCIFAEVAFVILDYHLNYGSLIDIGAVRRMFNIAREDGLASWFGTTQTLLVGLTLWLIFVGARHRRSSMWRRAGWLTLAIFFTFMAIDDGAQIHERLGSIFKAVASDDAELVDNYPSYAWQFVIGPVFAALGVFTLVFLWTELRVRLLRVLLLVAISCWAIAVGLDFIEGLDEYHPWNLYTITADHYGLDRWALDRFHEVAYDTLRHFSKSLEEALEMLAMSLFWFIFLRHLAVEPQDLRVQFL